jgi:hypothetical protein
MWFVCIRKNKFHLNVYFYIYKSFLRNSWRIGGIICILIWEFVSLEEEIEDSIQEDKGKWKSKCKNTHGIISIGNINIHF